MESKVWDYAVQQAPVVVFLGLVIWRMYAWIIKKDLEHTADRKEWLKELAELIKLHKEDTKAQAIEIRDLNRLNRDMSVDQLKFVHDIEDALAKSDPREAMNRILLITQNIADHFKIKTH